MIYDEEARRKAKNVWYFFLAAVIMTITTFTYFAICFTSKHT